MIKYIKNISLSGALFLLCMISCNSEDILEPCDINEDFFTVPENAVDDESVLRRNFHNETGVHLLFNDTIRREYRGKDAFGDEVWYKETVDFNYKLTQVLSAEYDFEYLTDMSEKEKAAEFIKDEIFSHLEKKLRPYSVLLLNKILVYEYSDTYYKTDWWEYNFRTGMRCHGLTMKDISIMNDDEKRAFCGNYFSTLINDKLDKDYTLDLSDFYSYSDKYYGEYKEDLDIEEEINDEQAREFGFLRDPYYYSYMFSDRDRQMYIKEMVSMSEDEFYEEYGEYPAVMAKYNILKNVLINYGFKF